MIHFEILFVTSTVCHQPVWFLNFRIRSLNMHDMFTARFTDYTMDRISHSCNNCSLPAYVAYKITSDVLIYKKLDAPLISRLWTALKQITALFHLLIYIRCSSYIHTLMQP